METSRAIAAKALCGGIAAAVLPFASAAATPLSRSALAACPAATPPVAATATTPVVRAAVIDDCLTVQGEEMAARALDTRLSIGVEVNGSGP
jgi:hypothetical protein